MLSNKNPITVGFSDLGRGAKTNVSSQPSYLEILSYLFIYLFIERGREGERERNINVVASCVPPTGDLAHNPGMCPDWESNQRPFGSQVGAQSIEPHQPGLSFISYL